VLGRILGYKKGGETGGGGGENCIMKNFIVVTLIMRLVGSVSIVANYELDELTFAIRCLVLGREFLHRAWNISGTIVQPNLRVRGAVIPCPPYVLLDL